MLGNTTNIIMIRRNPHTCFVFAVKCLIYHLHDKGKKSHSCYRVFDITSTIRIYIMHALYELYCTMFFNWDVRPLAGRITAMNIHNCLSQIYMNLALYFNFLLNFRILCDFAPFKYRTKTQQNDKQIKQKIWM